MTVGTLLRRSLAYHWRSGLALALAVAVGSAVMTGALLVGDSLRGSLRDRVENQLGGVRQALISDHPFTLAAARRFGDHVLPAFVASGAAEFQMRRTDGVSIIGVENVELLARFVGGREAAKASPPAGSALVTRELAARLGVRNGDSVQLRLPRYSAIPRESMLGRKSAEKAIRLLEVRVQILPAGHPLDAFSLTPSAVAPASVYLPLADASDPPGTVNTLLADTADPLDDPGHAAFSLADFQLQVKSPRDRAARLFDRLDANHDGRLDADEMRRRVAAIVREQWQPANDGSVKREAVERYFVGLGYSTLESESMVLRPAAVQAAMAASAELGLRAEPMIIYIADSLSDGSGEISYAVLAAPPPPLAWPLADDEILLADWLESPLRGKPGSQITLRYFSPEVTSGQVDGEATFRLKGRVALTGTAADPFIVPDVPGVTDELTLREWDPPFPYDARRVQPRDESYWERFRTTPKAYLSAAAARKLFASRFGVATIVKLFPRSAATSEEDTRAWESGLRAKLSPGDFGMSFTDLKSRADTAGQGATDFGGLFLGFSFYLVAAAVLLIVLSVRLAVERRGNEAGLLLALGFPSTTIRRVWLVEGILTSSVGAAFGLLISVVYAATLLRMLAILWPEEGLASLLRMHVTPTSLGIGFATSLLLSALAIGWALRGLKKVAAASLLRGETELAETQVGPPRRPWSAVGLLLLAAGMLLGGMLVEDVGGRAGLFFGGGGALLASLLLLFRYRLRQAQAASHEPPTTVAQLGRRNIARQPARSVLTVAILSAAAFLLIAVESFRRSPEGDFYQREGGSGGFRFVVECSLPVFQDLNDAKTGRQEMLDALETHFQREGGDKESRMREATSILAATTFVPMRVRAGDDAGCRNLLRPTQPRIVGAPRRLIERGGFRFDAPRTADPWPLLERRDDDAVPVFAEANTVKWILKKSLGDTITVANASGEPAKVRIVGLFHESIFSGELVMAEKRFLELFPETPGYSLILVDVPAERADELRQLLELGLARYGVMVRPARDRLTAYLAVENAYLSTFQLLGAFGFMLGVCGLAVVMVRATWERRAELALLGAVGFARADIRRLVLAENWRLFATGLGIGAIAAVASVVPQVVQTGVRIQVLRLAAYFAGVAAVGLLAGLWALRSVAARPVIEALRRE